MNAKPPPSAPRSFYETMSERRLDRHTLRGIEYRNRTVAGKVGGQGLRVLEIGPGEGGLTRLLAERGHRLTAVDLARGWFAALPAGRMAGAALAEMTRLPFAAASFDVVVAAEVIEHIAEIDLALAEAARVLDAGGRLVVTVPYRETLQHVTCPGCGARFERNGHLHTFDEDSLAARLRAAGLEPEARFVGPTRFSREILRRAPLAPLLPLLHAVDRLCYRIQRVSDTWMLMAVRRR